MTRVARACPAWPAPSSEGLLLSEPLAAKGSQGFGKKCNFRLGSKVLPQRDTTATSPFNSFGTSKGKGTTGGQHGPPNPTEGVRTCGSPFLTPGHPVTRPVGYQSAVSRGARRGRGTGPRGARAGAPGKALLPPSTGHTCPEFTAGLMAVAKGHGLSGTRTFLPGTSVPHRPSEGNARRSPAGPEPREETKGDKPSRVNALRRLQIMYQ